MTTLTCTDRSALEQLGARTTLPTPSRLAVKAAWVYLVWVQRYQSRRDLARLEGHLLDDIGLTPQEARVESRKWFWRS